ncbi:MAG: DoxX family protein [Candidatus Omnitrophota bacterium]
MMDLTSLVLRFGLGVMFMAHGLQKTFGLFGGVGMEEFSKRLAGLGFSPAMFWAILAAYVELLGGMALITGLSTRISSLLLLILITVATVKVHLARGFFMSNGGFEYNFIIACICLALLIVGTGKYGLNKKF